MPLDLPIDRQQLASVCRRYHVARLELFGSRARGEEHAGSDVDLLVTFADGYDPGLEFFGFANELEAVFGTTVDLLTRRVVEGDPNPYFREGVLADVEALYAA